MSYIHILSHMSMPTYKYAAILAYTHTRTRKQLGNAWENWDGETAAKISRDSSEESFKHHFGAKTLETSSAVMRAAEIVDEANQGASVDDMILHTICECMLCLYICMYIYIC
jgi:hypothetical protein